MSSIPIYGYLEFESMDIWKTRNRRRLFMSLGSAPQPAVTLTEIKYLKKILAAHISKLEEATLFDEDLQKKNVDFSRQILKKIDVLAEMKDKMLYLQLSGTPDGSIIVDEINLSVKGESVGRLVLK